MPDLHGNVAAAVSPGSTPVFLDAFRYDAYGETCASWTAGSGSIAVPWRFQGRILESASGATDLYDFGARCWSRREDQSREPDESLLDAKNLPFPRLVRSDDKGGISSTRGSLHRPAQVWPGTRAISGLTSKLRTRWRSPEGRALAWKVREALAAGHGLSRLSLAQVDGRLDLRGYEDPTDEPRVVDVSVPRTGRSVRLHERTWTAVIAGALEPVDLSGAQLRGFDFLRARLVGSKFDESDCRDIYVASSSFSRCSFRGVNFTEAFVGGLDWSKPTTLFESVDFGGSRMVHVSSDNACYKDCQFDDVTIRKSMFSSRFQDCTFSGLVDDVEFYGLPIGAPADRPRNEMAGVDFRGASLRWVGFKKIDLAPVALPRKDHIVLHHAACVLPLAIARLQDDPLPTRRGLGGLLEYALRSLDGDIVVLHRLDAGHDNEADAQWAEAFLRDLEADCAAGAQDS